MHENKINCPEAVLLILAMSVIGLNKKPAPKLKDDHLSHSHHTSASEQCIEVS